METVPYKVNNVDGEAEEENEKENSGEDLFSYRIFLGCEISGNEQKCQNTAINKGKSFITYRVIRSRQKLVEEIHQVKLPFKFPAGVGEGCFTKVERIVGRKNNNCCNTERQSRISDNTTKRTEEVPLFACGVVAEFCGTAEVVNKEIDYAVEAKHVADIEVAENCNCKRYYVKLKLAVLDDAFNTKGNQRQPHNSIDPHGVVLLNDGIGAKCIGCRKDNNGILVGLFGSFVHVKTKGCTAQSTFEHKETQKCFQYSFLGEESEEVRKRACKVVCINTQKFTAQLTGE